MDETQEQMTARIVAQTAVATAKAVSETAVAAALVIAKENTTTLTEIAVLKNDVAMLKHQQTSFETDMNRKMDSLSPKFEKLFTKLEEITLGRPTWAVSLIMGALFSICVGLIVFTITH